MLIREHESCFLRQIISLLALLFHYRYDDLCLLRSQTRNRRNHYVPPYIFEDHKQKFDSFSFFIRLFSFFTSLPDVHIVALFSYWLFALPCIFLQLLSNLLSCLFLGVPTFCESIEFLPASFASALVTLETEAFVPLRETARHTK